MPSRNIIEIILKAITGQASKELKGFGADLADLRTTSVKLATAEAGRTDAHINVAKAMREQGVTAADATAHLEKMGLVGQDLTDVLRHAGFEIKEVAETTGSAAVSFDTMGTAATIAKGAIIAVGAAFAVAKLAERAIEIADTAAATVALREGFSTLAARSQVDSQLLLRSLKEASKGTVSEYDLMKEANEAWYLGISQNTEQYTDLIKMAEVKSKDLGISTLEYWQRLNTAIASGYPIGLQNLGIVIDNERAYQDWGATIGVAADELTRQEQIQARVNAIIADGEMTLRRWETAEKDATTVTQEFHAATADLRAEYEERLLPVLIPGIEAITTALKASRDPMARQREVIAQLIEETGSLAEAEAQLAKNLYVGSQGFLTQELAAEQARIAMLDYKIALIGIDAGIQEDIRAMRMADQATIDWDDSLGELAETTDEAASAAKRAEDIWHSYTTNVSEENWRFTRRMEDLGFRQGQSAEDAAFRVYEIERNAAQGRGDLWDRFWLDERFETIRQHDKLRWMRQDYLDDLSDMEWDHLQEKRDILDKSPWWIRQALQKEFKERERIAKTGDKDALRQFDEALKERIRIVDPIYAKELDRLEEQYQHEQEIEERETGQAKQRRQTDWRRRDREQEARLRLQLGQLERGLGNQLEAWRHHDQQRRENERWAMDRLITENAHQLDRMHSDTEWRLSRLPELYREYGYQSWRAFVRGQAQAQQEQFAQMVGPYPFPTAPFAFQQGAWEIPRRMMGILDRGEMVIPAGPAERMREGGGMTIEIGQIVVPSSFTPQQGRQFGRAVVEAMGPELRKQHR